MGEMLDKGPLSSPTTITSTTRANRSRRITRQLTSIRASRRFLSPDGLRHEARRTVRAVSFPDWRRSQRPQSISTNSASEIEPPQTSKVDASKNETIQTSVYHHTTTAEPAVATRVWHFADAGAWLRELHNTIPFRL